jgi:hypothetical protein
MLERFEEATRKDEPDSVATYLNDVLNLDGKGTVDQVCIEFHRGD